MAPPGGPECDGPAQSGAGGPRKACQTRKGGHVWRPNVTRPRGGMHTLQAPSAKRDKRAGTRAARGARRRARAGDSETREPCGVWREGSRAARARHPTRARGKEQKRDCAHCASTYFQPQQYRNNTLTTVTGRKALQLYRRVRYLSYGRTGVHDRRKARRLSSQDSGDAPCAVSACRCRRAEKRDVCPAIGDARVSAVRS